MTDVGLYSLDEDSNVVFSLANIDRLVSGPEEALQIAAHHLFQTPGTNTYNRDEGGGLRSLISGPLRSRQETAADSAIIVNRARDSILRSQSGDKPADATITDLRLLDVVVNRSALSIAVKIRIDLLDGNSFQATFRVT